MQYSRLSIPNPYTLQWDEDELTFFVECNETIMFDEHNSNWDRDYVVGIQGVNVTSGKVEMTAYFKENDTSGRRTFNVTLAFKHPTSSIGNMEEINITFNQDFIDRTVTIDADTPIVTNQLAGFRLEYSYTITPSMDYTYDGNILTVENTGGDSESSEWRVTLKENKEDYSVPSTLYIPFRESDGGRLMFTYEVPFVQRPKKHNMIPIWKDTYYESRGLEEALDYVILHNDEVIFRGRAYADEDGVISVNISDIARDYLHSKATFNSETVSDTYFGTFQVVDEAGNELNTFCFYDDYSYDDVRANSFENWRSDAPMNLNAPIVTSLPAGAYAPISMACVNKVNGEIEASYEIDIDGDDSITGDIPMGKKVDLFIKAEKSVGDYTFDLCGKRYVLYYKNAFGGYDAMAMSGSVRKSASLERHNVENRYKHNTLQFGNRNYKNDIVEKWALNTGYLNDSQCDKMFHIFGTTEAYLLDLEENRIIPVVISDDTFNYKRFDTEHTLARYYIINVEASQTKYRR